MQDASLPSFWQKKEHQRILSLTLPMILANSTAPLIGLVDTAVLGHMDGEFYLAGGVSAAVFLAAPASDFVTGHILYVDGGLLSTFGPTSW